MHDISNLDTRLLSAFVAILEEGSVTRAAKRLAITQQGLSGILARLRSQFDDPLFVRIAHGVTPTPRAVALYPKVVAAIESLRNVMQEQAFEPSKIDTVFYVATSDYALSVIIQPLFKRLQNLAPNLRLAVVPLQIETLFEQMRLGQVDLALTVPEFVPDNLYTSTLFSDRYKCVFRKNHPIAAQKLTRELFCGAKHLLVAPNGKSQQSSVDITLAKTGHSRTISVSVPGFLVATSLLINTDLLALLPSRTLKNAPDQLQISEPPFEIPPFDIICAWPERVHADPVNVWFRQILGALITP